MLAEFGEGSIFFEGNPCSKGHTKRYKSSRSCVECTAKRGKEYNERNYLRCKLSAAKHRAKKSGVPFELTLTDLPEIPIECPILHIPLLKNINAAPSDSSPSLDRIFPWLGYVPDNIHWISNRANRIKSNATWEEILDVAEYLMRLELGTAYGRKDVV